LKEEDYPVNITENSSLLERVKELNCLYVLSKRLRDSKTVEEAVNAVLEEIRSSLQFPEKAASRVVLNSEVYSEDSEWFAGNLIESKLIVYGEELGSVGVSYRNADSDDPFFLKEEENLLEAIAGNLANAIERILSFDSFLEGRERLNFAIEASKDGLWDWNVETGEVFFSRRWKEIIGYSEEEISNSVEEWESRVHPADLERVEKLLQDCLDGEIPHYETEHRLRAKDGSYRWILDRGKVVSRDANGKPLRMVGVHTDLTEHYRIEEELRRYNRALRFLSEANQFFVRAKTEESLLKGICDIATKYGGYALAWIAYKGPAGNDLIPMASSGFSSTYPSKIKVTCDESELGRSATGRAIRTGMTIVKKSIDTDPEYAPWRETIQSYGFKAAIALPLNIGEETIGGLNIYSTAEEAFDSEEVKLLEELAGDLAYGIFSLRNELVAARFGRVLDWSVNEIYMFDFATFRFIQTNKGAIENTGYSFEELKGMTPLDLSRDMTDVELRKMTGYLKTGRDRSLIFESTHTRKNGTKYPVEVRLQLYDDGFEKMFIAVIVDITARKNAEESIKNSLDSLITTLSALVESRDPYTYGHQKRVSELATAIARKVFAPEREKTDRIDAVRVAALLHDIGKNSVPGEILTKPLSLTQIEFALIKEHSRHGYEILKDVYFPWPIAEIVRQHHERLDGSGYPDGLSGEEISLEARIIAVADVVEAMSSHRPYRAALGLNAALEEIRKNSGILYDPSVVAACTEVFEEGFQLSG